MATTPVAICEKCGKVFSIKRKMLGYNTCLQCGEVQAHQERPVIYEALTHDRERLSIMVCC